MNSETHSLAATLISKMPSVSEPTAPNPPLIFWHGSDADFETFSDKFLVRPDSGPNSALGIWLGEAWVSKNFGQFTYKVECRFKNILYMGVGAMMRHHNQSSGDRAYFDDLRQAYLAQDIDAIFIREADGSCPTIVALDLDALSIVGRE